MHHFAIMNFQIVLLKVLKKNFLSEVISQFFPHLFLMFFFYTIEEIFKLSLCKYGFPTFLRPIPACFSGLSPTRR